MAAAAAAAARAAAGAASTAQLALRLLLPPASQRAGPVEPGDCEGYANSQALGEAQGDSHRSVHVLAASNCNPPFTACAGTPPWPAPCPAPRTLLPLPERVRAAGARAPHPPP